MKSPFSLSNGTLTIDRGGKLIAQIYWPSGSFNRMILGGWQAYLVADTKFRLTWTPNRRVFGWTLFGFGFGFDYSKKV